MDYSNLKGRIAEALVENIFHLAGYRVARIGDGQEGGRCCECGYPFENPRPERTPSCLVPQFSSGFSPPSNDRALSGRRPRTPAVTTSCPCGGPLQRVVRQHLARGRGQSFPS